jgi:hypothetical protein
VEAEPGNKTEQAGSGYPLPALLYS